ncbi:MAG: glyceraldehyde dehydrogenase small chain [Candidatus Micrarchaeota archaeon]|nr:MAG: glyceraldehyde dehydrogenase small chain [Candidatus Micrarchaeota archaeon]
MANEENGLRKSIKIVVNGTRYSLYVEPRMLLVHLLRDKLGIKSVHIGCDSAQCGACSVIMNNKLVKSCNVFAVQAADSEILTLEGLKDNPLMRSAIDSFIKSNAYQCGYCTPGMLNLLYYIKSNKDSADASLDINDMLIGNICRCTGYINIIKAFKRELGAQDGGSDSR